MSEVRVPTLGEGADSGTVVSILVKEGDAVKKEQTIIELENEKAVAPIPSTADGVIAKIHVKEGDKASVGQLVVTLDGEGGGNASADSGSQDTVAPAEQAPAAPAPQPQMPAAPVQPLPPQGGYQYQSPSGMAPPASPTVRKVAKELGIDLTRVPGSQNGGRIVMDDLRGYIARLQVAATQPAPVAAAPAPAAPAAPQEESIDFSKWGSVKKEKLSPLRKTIARKMSESWNTIPHVTQFDEVDITDLMDLRKKHKGDYEKAGGRLTLTSFVLKASVKALQELPIFNTSIDLNTNELIQKEYYHLGVAVDTDQGLIVPVIRDADKKDMLELSIELDDLAARTRDRKVSGEELKGGCFTISNLGGIGGTHFTPIVNKPEVAILGVGKGVLKPVIVKGKIEQRIMLPVCVSYDHRVIDGANGARFIRTFIEALESIKNADVAVKKAAKK